MHVDDALKYASAAMMKAKIIMADCVTMSILRLFTWSAITPPMSANSRMGNRRGKAHHAQPECGVGELQHQPALGDVLHPGANVGEEVAGPEEPEVAVAQGAGKARNFNDGGFGGVSYCGAL